MEGAEEREGLGDPVEAGLKKRVMAVGGYTVLVGAMPLFLVELRLPPGGLVWLIWGEEPFKGREVREKGLQLRESVLKNRRLASVMTTHSL